MLRHWDYGSTAFAQFGRKIVVCRDPAKRARTPDTTLAGEEGSPRVLPINAGRSAFLAIVSLLHDSNGAGDEFFQPGHVYVT